MTGIPLKDMEKTERDAHVDRHINAALSVGLQHKQDAAQMAFIDTVVRPAMKWINDMEAGGTDVPVVENAMASGISAMMAEITLRVNKRDDIEGGRAFAQAMIERIASYLGEAINLNFHPPKGH